MELFVIAWAILATVAASIAKAKGRSFFVWLLYGLVLMPVALIHSLTIKTGEIHYQPISLPSSLGAEAPFSVADELAKLADLHERGVITQEEFQIQKKKLLRELMTTPYAAA
jgi:hypothetical protein